MVFLWFSYVEDPSRPGGCCAGGGGRVAGDVEELPGADTKPRAAVRNAQLLVNQVGNDEMMMYDNGKPSGYI